MGLKLLGPRSWTGLSGSAENQISENVHICTFMQIMENPKYAGMKTDNAVGILLKTVIQTF